MAAAVARIADELVTTARLLNALDRSPLDGHPDVVHRSLRLRVRFPVDDMVLSDLHARAFGVQDAALAPWARRLERHALTWVGAFEGETLRGFVHASWDGGEHAFVLDTMVDPDHQRLGIGQALVAALVREATAAGCQWLHVDYEPHLATFYREACGFPATDAGLLRLPR